MPHRRLIASLIPLACLAVLASCAHRPARPASATEPTTAPTTLPTSAPTSAPAPPRIATLFVDVTDLHSRRGQLLVCVFDRRDGFPGDATRAVLSQMRPIDPRSAGSVRVAFALPPGNYAVSVVHDENRNGKLDTGLMGIPSEGYGVSNNPKPLAGPPKFEAARFELPAKGATLRIGVRYF